MKKISLILGVILVIIAGFLTFENIQMITGNGYTTAPGTIIEYSKDGYPIVEFSIDADQTRRVQSPFTARVNGKNTSKISDPMEVIYPDGAPQKAKIKNFSGMWGEPIGLGVLGLLFVGNFVWWWRKKNHK